MSNSDYSIIGKNYISDEEKCQNLENYIQENKEALQDKLKDVPYPFDYPFSMSNGDLFSKFSIEYIKNIIFDKKGTKYAEKVTFNFFNYVKAFTESEHSEIQKELFENIIGLKGSKTAQEDRLFMGDFDLVIYSIRGEVILKALNKYKYNLYHYPGKEIKSENQYCLICEIKMNYFKQSKECQKQVKKQFIKYKKILELLSSKPNLEKIKNTIGLNSNNEIIFMLATNGDFFLFDYLRYSKSNFKEDINNNNVNTDIEKKHFLPKQLIDIDNISKLEIPVLLLFVPKTLDDNGIIYKNKFQRKIEKKLEDIEMENKKLKEDNQKMEKKMEILEQKIIEILEEKEKKEENEKVKLDKEGKSGFGEVKDYIEKKRKREKGDEDDDFDF